ncbi:STAS-like domain-containing protein [Candidatus Woesearchaeota archaeon]|nr:STAS-like domain-containing protein [Candidatus Woesearchaeota archaeon]
MKEIALQTHVGKFAENKDIARDIRITSILPALEKGEDVILDFQGIDSATQSFIHALISDVIRRKGIAVLDRMYFKNCNTTVQKIINIVVDYMQGATEPEH